MAQVALGFWSTSSASHIVGITSLCLLVWLGYSLYVSSWYYYFVLASFVFFFFLICSYFFEPCFPLANFKTQWHKQRKSHLGSVHNRNYTKQMLNWCAWHTEATLPAAPPPPPQPPITRLGSNRHGDLVFSGSKDQRRVKKGACRWAGWCTPGKPTLERLRNEYQELKISVGYVASLRPAEATWDPVSTR